MKFSETKYKTRREFIKTCLRFGIGGGLILTGIALGLRKKAGNIETDLCQLSTRCGGCSKYNDCKLPQAITAKKEEGGHNGPK
jgi:hypothetical protein